MVSLCMYFVLAATTSLAVGKSDTSMPKGRSSSSRSYLWTNNYPCSFVHNRYQNYAGKSNDKNNFATMPPNNRHFLTVRRGKQCCLNASRGEEGRDQPAQPSAETTRPTAMPKSQQSSQQVMSSSTGNNREKMFNVVLTHCTADFDSLASAVGLAKLWTASTHPPQDFTNNSNIGSATTDDDPTSAVLDAKQANIPTYVVLPRGAHPAVQRFLSLHKHLFPIRSLKSLPADLSGLYRLGLVDAQRRDRVGPAEPLIQHAKQVLIMDHHIDSESDIPEVTDYIVEHVGSVSTMVVERLRNAQVPLTEAEATLLALGIHADTGSLRFDSTTARDAKALAWVMEQGASQTAIAEHAKSSLSEEQQGVLTQALLNTNSSVVHGVTVSTVLLSSEGFINGLAAVTQDALELTGSDVMLVAVVYDPKAAPSSRNSSSNLSSSSLRKKIGAINEGKLHSQILSGSSIPSPSSQIMHAEAWKGGEEMFKRRRLRAAFEKRDSDGSGYLERREISAALASSGVVTSDDVINSLMDQIDHDGDGKIDFEEFVSFSERADKIQKENEHRTGRRTSTMIIIGRVKTGINVKAVNLNRLFQQFGGGGHAKAASATIRLEDESHAGNILQQLIDELIESSLLEQPTVGNFMTAPVLAAKPTMTEKQVEDLFTHYDVRALPVVDAENNVVGIVTYKEVAAAKQRLWNKEQKRLRRKAMEDAASSTSVNGVQNLIDQSAEAERVRNDRKMGSPLSGWMKQHVRLVEASMSMAEVENVLLESDVGCIPVVADGTKKLVGMVTRTDLLRQHKYYPSLHYHNKGYADSIAARKPIIELRRKLKQFDLESE